MTSQATQSPNEFVRYMPHSDPTTTPDVNVRGLLETTTSRRIGKVIHLSFAEQNSPLPPGFTSITDHVFALEADPEQANHIREARKALASVLDVAIGPTIRSLRLGKGLSQAQLAQIVGTSQPQIARIEAGKHDPTYDTFEKLSLALALDVTAVVAAFRNVRRTIRISQAAE